MKSPVGLLRVAGMLIPKEERECGQKRAVVEGGGGETEWSTLP